MRVEATPDYLHSVGCAERIARGLDGARVVFSLRDPLTRLWSWYRYARQTARLEDGASFEDFLARQLPAGTAGAEQALRALEQGCYAGYLEGNGCNPTTRTYNNPSAGVWELVVESRRTSPLLDNPYHLEATITQ